MFTTRGTTIAASALLLISLAACSGGGGGGGGGEDEGSGGGGSPTDCLIGKTWVLDLTDLAGQLAEKLGSSGLSVTQSEGAGRQDFEFDAGGGVTSHVDVTYTITIVQDDLTLTLIQTHGGDPSGEWAWQGDTANVVFSNWDNAGYSVQNQFLVNGTASDNAMTIPSEDLGDGSVMATTCSGDTLSTTVTGSPFTQHWTAES